MPQPHLFDEAGRPSAELTPLAARMRPRSLDEILGQEHLLAPGRALRRALEADKVPSMVLWGPPGSGKTTLAEVIARLTRSRFVALSAVTAGVADLRKVVEVARRTPDERTIMFIDEIHRFNKTQQDAVLPHVESGLVTLLGATTENPSFEVNAALLSRSRVVRLEALAGRAIDQLLDRALVDKERGLGRHQVTLEDSARSRLLSLSGGDARIALNALELAVHATLDSSGAATVTAQDIEGALQQPALLYDRAGDQHYWLISAFIKALRGSDPDAAVYWMARMLESGEDPLFVARRMVILAAEDVGLADPQALTVAVAAQQAAHFVGMPEAVLPLTAAALYLALAPKSNSALTSYGAARDLIQESGNEPVPMHLRNAPTGLMKSMGYGKGYKYAHDHEGGVADQVHMPEKLKSRKVYKPNPRDKKP